MPELITTLVELEERLFGFVRILNNTFFEGKYYPVMNNEYFTDAFNFAEKRIGDNKGDVETEDQDAKEEKEEIKINPYLFLYQSRKPEYFGWIIRKVPRMQLGYGVLGRAFPYRGLIEIASDLYGNDFEEVKMHEILHMQNPEKSEPDIRMLTKMVLPFEPRWH